MRRSQREMVVRKQKKARRAGGGDAPRNAGTGRIGESDTGEKAAGKTKAKEAGIAVAIVGAVAAVCVAGLNSGAYTKVWPGFLCGPPSPSTSAAPTVAVSGPQPTGTQSAAGGGSQSEMLADGGQRGDFPALRPVPTSLPKNGATTPSAEEIQGTAAASGSRHDTTPIGDFGVSLLEDYGCLLRSGDAGAWDIDIWYTVNWVSPDNHPMPTGSLRVTTDLARSKDWSLNALGSPGGYLDTFVDRDDRYLGRFVTVKATVRPDGEVPESSMENNSLTLSVDLRGGLPPAGTNLRVPCSKT